MSKRVPKENDVPMWAFVVFSWFGFCCGYVTRYGIEKHSHPTAVVETTSEAKGRTDGK